MAVWGVAGADGFELGADFCGDGGFGLHRERQVAGAVANRFYRSYRCGGAYGEGFGQLFALVGFEEFVHRDGALGYFDLHFAEQREDGIAGDAGENRTPKRRRDSDSVDHENDIHQAALFDEFARGPIEPEDAVKAFFLRFARREQTAGVVPCCFGGPGASRESSDVGFFGEQFQWLAEVRAYGAGHDGEAIAGGWADEESLFRSEVERADVERAALGARDPFAVDADELDDAIEKRGGIEFRHGEALRGALHAREIVFDAEEGDGTVVLSKGFEALEDALTVVQGAGGR